MSDITLLRAEDVAAILDVHVIRRTALGPPAPTRMPCRGSGHVSTDSTNEGPMNDNKLLDLPAVRGIVALSKSQIYEMMDRGEFPKQVKIGRLARWLSSDVQSWIASLTTAA